MKKRVLSLVLCICMVAAVLAGCGCKHEYKNATCVEPITCALCGETEGEPLGHTWQDATCEAPKTCVTCSATEGEALGHTWQDATCEAPKTCSVCAATEGEALEHAFGEWEEVDAETEERSCADCGFAEERTIDREAMMLSLLEGEWIMEEAIVGDGVVTVDELPADFETSKFSFNSDGSGQLDLMGESLEGVAKFYSYEKDGTDDYTFEFYVGSEFVDCILCYDEAGDTFLLMALDETTGLIFYQY